VACSQTPKGENKPLILVPIAPYAYFVDKICGDAVEVICAVPAGTDPHVYEPTHRDVEKMGRTGLWIRIGEPLEEKIRSVVPQEAITLVLDEGAIHPSGHHHDEIDRHFWMSPVIARHQVEKIATALEEMVPEKAADFRVRHAALAQELEALDGELREALIPMKGKAVFVAHPALGHYCDIYGLVQLSLEAEGKEPRPEHLAHLFEELAHADLAAVFTQPQHPSKGALLVAERLGRPAHEIDPYAYDYVSMMRQITHWIVDETTSRD
jgi:zinc transport system substrate-binding protein